MRTDPAVVRCTGATHSRRVRTVQATRVRALSPDGRRFPDGNGNLAAARQEKWLLETRHVREGEITVRSSTRHDPKATRVQSPADRRGRTTEDKSAGPTRAFGAKGGRPRPTRPRISLGWQIGVRAPSAKERPPQRQRRPLSMSSRPLSASSRTLAPVPARSASVPALSASVPARSSSAPAPSALAPAPSASVIMRACLRRVLRGRPPSAILSYSGPCRRSRFAISGSSGSERLPPRSGRGCRRSPRAGSSST